MYSIAYLHHEEGRHSKQLSLSRNPYQTSFLLRYDDDDDDDEKKEERKNILIIYFFFFRFLFDQFRYHSMGELLICTPFSFDKRSFLFKIFHCIR